MERSISVLNKKIRELFSTAKQQDSKVGKEAALKMLPVLNSLVKFDQPKAEASVRSLDASKALTEKELLLLVRKAMPGSRAKSVTPSRRSVTRSKTSRNVSAVKKTPQRSTSAVRGVRRSKTARTARSATPVASDTSVDELRLRLNGHEVELTAILSKSDVFDAFEHFLEKTRIKRGPQYQAFVTELQAWMGHKNSPGQIPKLKYPEFVKVVTQWFSKHRPEFLRVLPIKTLRIETYALLLMQIARDFEQVKTYLPAKATEIDAKVQKSQATISALIKAVNAGKGLADLKLTAKHIQRDAKGVVRLITGLKGESSASIRSFYNEAIGFYKSQLKFLQTEAASTPTTERSKRTTATSRKNGGEVAPAKKSTTARKTSVTPGGKSPRPGGRSATPGGETRPGGRSATPGGRSATPGGKTRPGGRSVTPSGKSPRPGKRSTTPGGKSPRPGKRSVTPGGKSPRPGGKSPAPERKKTGIPSKKGAAATDRSATPTKSKATDKSATTGKKSTTARSKTIRKKSVTPRGKSKASIRRSKSALPRNKSAVPRNRSATPGKSGKRATTPRRSVSPNATSARDSTPRKGTTTRKSVISKKNMKEYQTQNKLFTTLQKLQNALDQDAKEDVAVLGGAVLDLREVLLNIWKAADSGGTYISTVEPFAKPCSNFTVQTVKTELFHLTKFKQAEKNMRASKDNKAAYLEQLSKHRDALAKGWLTPLEAPKPKVKKVNVGLSSEEVTALKEMIGELEDIRQKRLVMDRPTSVFEAKASVQDMSGPQTKTVAVGNEYHVKGSSEDLQMLTTFGENAEFADKPYFGKYNADKKNKNFDHNHEQSKLPKIEEEAGENGSNPISTEREKNQEEKTDEKQLQGQTSSEPTIKKNALDIDQSSSDMLSIQALKKENPSTQQAESINNAQETIEISEKKSIAVDKPTLEVNVGPENNLQKGPENETNGLDIQNIQKAGADKKESDDISTQKEELKATELTQEKDSGKNIEKSDEKPAKKMLYYMPGSDTSQVNKAPEVPSQKESELNTGKELNNLETATEKTQVPSKEGNKTLGVSSSDNMGLEPLQTPKETGQIPSKEGSKTLAVSSSDNMGLEPLQNLEMKKQESESVDLISTPSIKDVGGARNSLTNKETRTGDTSTNSKREFAVSSSNGMNISPEKKAQISDSKEISSQKPDTIQMDKLDNRKETESESFGISPAKKETQIDSQRKELIVSPSTEEISFIAQHKDTESKTPVKSNARNYEIQKSEIDIAPPSKNNLRATESNDLSISPTQREGVSISHNSPKLSMTANNKDEILVKAEDKIQHDKKNLGISSSDEVSLKSSIPEKKEKDLVVSSITNEGAYAKYFSKEKNLKNSAGDEITIHSRNTEVKDSKPSFVTTSNTDTTVRPNIPKPKNIQMAYSQDDLSIQPTTQPKKQDPVKTFNVSSGDTMGISGNKKSEKNLNISPLRTSQELSVTPRAKPPLSDQAGDTLTIETKPKNMNTAQNSLNIQSEHKKPQFIVASKSEMDIPSQRAEEKLQKNMMISPKNDGITIEQKNQHSNEAEGSLRNDSKEKIKELSISKAMVQENSLRNQTGPDIGIQSPKNLNSSDLRPQERAFGERSSRKIVHKYSNEELVPLKTNKEVVVNNAQGIPPTISSKNSVQSPKKPLTVESNEKLGISSEVNKINLKDTSDSGIGVSAATFRPFFSTSGDQQEINSPKSKTEITDSFSKTQTSQKQPPLNINNIQQDLQKEQEALHLQISNQNKYQDFISSLASPPAHRAMDIKEAGNTMKNLDDLSKITEEDSLGQSQQEIPANSPRSEQLSPRLHGDLSQKPSGNINNQYSKPKELERTNLKQSEEISPNPQNHLPQNSSEPVFTQNQRSQQSGINTSYKNQEEMLRKLQEDLERIKPGAPVNSPPIESSPEIGHPSNDNHPEDQTGNFNYIDPSNVELTEEPVDSEMPRTTIINVRSSAPSIAAELKKYIHKQSLSSSKTEKELPTQEKAEIRGSNLESFSFQNDNPQQHGENRRAHQSQGKELPQPSSSNTNSLKNSGNHPGSKSAERLLSNPFQPFEDKHSDKVRKTDKRLRELIGVYKYIRSEREKNGEGLEKVDKMIQHYTEQLNKLGTSQKSSTKPPKKASPSKSDFIGQQYIQYSSGLGHVDLGAFLRFCSDFNILRKKNRMSEKELSNKLLLTLFDSFSNLHGEMDENMFRHVFKRLADCYFDIEYDLIHSTSYSRLPASRKVEIFCEELSKRSYKRGRTLAPVIEKPKKTEDLFNYNLSEGARNLLSPKIFHTKTSFN